MQAEAWSMVLAAGAGRRLSPVTGDVPKQFWQHQHGTSLLNETLCRLAPLIPATRTITVVDDSHRRFIAEFPNRETLGDVVYQPLDRGTATGVLLGLVEVAARAGDATVFLTPSDHGVLQPEVFREGLRNAARAIDYDDRRVVLLGAQPDLACPDYGWISSAQPLQPFALAPVARFFEKPSADKAVELYRSGAVWNTMVLAARTTALLALFRRHLPALYRALGPLVHLGAADRRAFAAAVYPALPRLDFSRDVLAHATSLSVLAWPASLGWLDLGTPERYAAWTNRPRTAAPVTPAA
jgi:mannose-1-phosphate guanylyltransferase